MRKFIIIIIEIYEIAVSFVINQLSIFSVLRVVPQRNLPHVQILSNRLRLRLRVLPEQELQLVDDRPGVEDEKTEGRKMMDRKLAKHVETVSKLHDSLESKILARHNEL